MTTIKPSLRTVAAHIEAPKPAPPPPAAAPAGRPAVGSVFQPSAVRPAAPTGPASKLHFVVHPGMQELQDFARSQGWTAQGFTQLSVPWQDLVYTTDHWKTTQTLKSTDVPSPIVNGQFFLPNVPKGTDVEFAIHVGVACHAPADIAGYRERGDLWLNNGGQNYHQISQ